MLSRAYSAAPYRQGSWLLLPLWPLTALAALVLRVAGRVFVSHAGERVGGEPVQTWVVPRFGFQYFLGAREERSINRLIARAIADADKQGVKVRFFLFIFQSSLLASSWVLLCFLNNTFFLFF